MSLVLSLNSKSSDYIDKLTSINNDLELKIESKFGNGEPKYVYPFKHLGKSESDQEEIVLPFAYGVKCMKLSRPMRSNFSAVNVNFTGSLREEQLEIKKEAIRNLSSTGSILISLYTGGGKTVTAINIASSIGFRTLVIVNKIVLIQQWKDSINRFCHGATIQCLTPKTKEINSDFCIVNAQNIEKFPRGFFDDIGLCIVDEAHMIMAETLSRSMFYIHPRYLIGLTATPYRPDGLDILLSLCFGSKKIIRKLYRRHTVFKVDTGYKPPIKKTIQGRLDWNSILDAQANNVNRNNIIIQLIKSHPTRNFLVLVKRVSQGEYLSQLLRDEGEYVTDLIGSNQEFCKDARILIGTCQKVGVGFDHVKLDTLLLAADIEEYFIQYLGRVFRSLENEPIIFDLVDKNPVLEKHFNTRRDIYQSHGGTIKEFVVSN